MNEEAKAAIQAVYIKLQQAWSSRESSSVEITVTLTQEDLQGLEDAITLALEL